jgi:hypothetical protein
MAQKFDAENWLYNTRERFDMFYPSYGDTHQPITEQWE